MNTTRLCILLCLSATAVIAHAAAKDHAEATPGTVAGTVENSVPMQPVATASIAKQPASAGTAESLPDLPAPHAPALSFRAVPAGPIPVARPSRVSLTTQPSNTTQGHGVSLLASMPLAGAARRLGAQRFNTDDGSMLDDFAICYRMSGRSSIEIIPGDPAPVKLPVVSMANNTGVTVGLVLRMSK